MLLLLTHFKQFGTVLTESFFMVPVNVPTFAGCDATAFTPDASHADLQTAAG